MTTAHINLLHRILTAANYMLASVAFVAAICIVTLKLMGAV